MLLCPRSSFSPPLPSSSPTKSPLLSSRSVTRHNNSTLELTFLDSPLKSRLPSSNNSLNPGKTAGHPLRLPRKLLSVERHSRTSASGRSKMPYLQSLLATRVSSQRPKLLTTPFLLPSPSRSESPRSPSSFNTRPSSRRVVTAVVDTLSSSRRDTKPMASSVTRLHGLSCSVLT